MKTRMLEILVSKQASRRVKLFHPASVEYKHLWEENKKKLPMLILKTKMLRVHSKTFVLLINMNKILGLVATLSLSMIVFSLWAIVSTVQSANSFLWITIRSAQRSG